jgi:ribosomal protein L12E/L44/L45/RPP1/RPP2
MKSVFAHFGVKIDNDSLEIIMNKFNDVLDDITDKIKKTKGSAVTYSNVKIILSKGKIMKK